MTAVFDLETTRRRLLDDSRRLDWQLESALKAREATKINFGYWRNVLHDVLTARVVGLGADPRVDRMLKAILDVLGPLDWPMERRRLLAEAGADVSLRSNRLHIAGSGPSARATT